MNKNKHTFVYIYARIYILIQDVIADIHLVYTSVVVRQDL